MSIDIREEDYKDGYVIFDKEYNRIMVLEGFCYSPADEKRDVMFELESIIKSVQIIKRRK